MCDGRVRRYSDGELVGEDGAIPASGKSVELPFAEVFTVRDGRIVHQESYWDQMTLLAQIGALPAG